MSWRPRGAEPSPHPRLSQLDRRVAAVLDGDLEVGTLLLRADSWARQTGGALWWRRWSASRHAAILHLVAPGLGVTYDDSVVHPDDLEDELDLLAAGRFEWVGRTYGLRWLDRAESARVAEDIFGM